MTVAELPAGPQGHGRAGPGRAGHAARTSTAPWWSGSIRRARRACGRTASWSPAAGKILDSKAAILAVDVFGTGELERGAKPAVNAKLRRLHLRLQPAAAGQPRPRHPDGGGLRPAATRRRKKVHLVGPGEGRPVGGAGARPVRRRRRADRGGLGRVPLRRRCKRPTTR